jgi:hypothetical protein
MQIFGKMIDADHENAHGTLFLFRAQSVTRGGNTMPCVGVNLDKHF